MQTFENETSEFFKGTDKEINKEERAGKKTLQQQNVSFVKN